MRTIINERFEVMKYLQGENLHRDIEYRICLLLSKWFYENGATTIIDIRNNLKAWAMENDFYLTVPMNPIAQKVIENDMVLLGETPIHINNNDIAAIIDRFDTYYDRKIALGLICYSKAYAVNGRFKLSQGMFAHWLNMNSRTVRKYLDIMLSCDFLEKYDSGKVNSWYKKYVVAELNTFNVTIPLVNDGDYILQDNDIDKLYEEIFEKEQLPIVDKWYSIPDHNNWYEISNTGKVRVKERTIDGRTYPAKVIRPYKSKSGKPYVSLYDPMLKKQKKYAISKLLEIVLT